MHPVGILVQGSKLEMVIEDSTVKKLTVNGLPPIFAGDRIRAYIDATNYPGELGPTRRLYENENPEKIEKLDPETGYVLATYNFTYSRDKW